MISQILLYYYLMEGPVPENIKEKVKEYCFEEEKPIENDEEQTILGIDLAKEEEEK